MDRVVPRGNIDLLNVLVLGAGLLAMLLADRGASLSGGQRQRNALARALVQRRAILLLDEATSNFDAVTEASIQRELADLAATRILIAYRLSSIRDADLIILVMDAGRLVEQGHHDELVTRDGVYAELVRGQMERKRKQAGLGGGGGGLLRRSSPNARRSTVAGVHEAREGTPGVGAIGFPGERPAVLGFGIQKPDGFAVQSKLLRAIFLHRVTPPFDVGSGIIRQGGVGPFTGTSSSSADRCRCRSRRSCLRPLRLRRCRNP
ncbi:MAG: ATP-binding cassette domain-containing protein [Thermoanaerobaculia bacterium]